VGGAGFGAASCSMPHIIKNKFISIKKTLTIFSIFLWDVMGIPSGLSNKQTGDRTTMGSLLEIFLVKLCMFSKCVSLKYRNGANKTQRIHDLKLPGVGRAVSLVPFSQVKFKHQVA
jgi:hypothetical protein